MSTKEEWSFCINDSCFLSGFLQISTIINIFNLI